MSTKAIPLVKFASKEQDGFYDTIRQRVNDYFQTHDISKHSNTTMHVKTVVMLSMYFIPFLFIVTGLSSVSLWLFYPLWLIMGVGIAGIGTSVMHDSNHGAYSANPTVNFLFGSVLNVIGGYSRNWRIQHNILHHTYTNLEGLDEDIEAGILLRMSPHKKLKAIHRYQHVYAWFLYSLMNLFWVTVKDYKALVKYAKTGLLKKEKITFPGAIVELTAFKLFYITYMILLPILFAGVPWFHVLIGFVLMQMVAGFLLACVFQLAHVMEESEYPVPADDSKMSNSWAVHQLLNTVNFAPKNKPLSWFIGGLNYQIEHHLFPQICHVHYPRISKIVQQVAKELNLPYNVQPTFRAALAQHGQMLKKLGRGSK